MNPNIYYRIYLKRKEFDDADMIEEFYPTYEAAKAYADALMSTKRLTEVYVTIIMEAEVYKVKGT